ncbi:MAG: RNA methyltransferase [Actinobacteria bacterium]|nr:MAG: RNA methyltransferase [Actinomycetota bacterium]
MIIEVDDASDERLNAFRWRERQLNTIAQRKAAQVNNLESTGMFVAEGDLVVRRALEAGCKPSVVLCDPKCAQDFVADITQHGGITLSASADIRREVTGLGVPLDAIGVFHRPALRDAQTLISTSNRLVILDCIDNPSNVGAIARSAVALGWDAMLLDTTSSDPLTRRALRVSMGTTFNLPYARIADMPSTLSDLVTRGFAVVGMALSHPSRPVVPMTHVRLDDTQPRALVLGSERQGLSQSTIEACTILTSIPMAPGIDSLNVASATAIACYALK